SSRVYASVWTGERWGPSENRQIPAKKDRPFPPEGEGRHERCQYPTRLASCRQVRKGSLSSTQDSGREDESAPTAKPLRTVVFVDYQNMYRGARRAYGWEHHQGHFGNLKPIGIGRVLAPAPARDLTQVRVYTGIP